MEDKKDMQNKHIPKVSIGMPVYNGERYLAGAIESILSQTYQNWEILVSDNASTDDTPKIIANYMAQDSRIKYIRQSKNIGGLFNWEYVRNKANSEKYFLWHADDDMHHPRFLEVTVDLLERNPDMVLANSLFKRIDDDEKETMLSETARHNRGLLRLNSQLSQRNWFYRTFVLRYQCGNNMIYGLMRCETLKNAPPLSSNSFETILPTMMVYFGSIGIYPGYLYIRREHKNSAAHQPENAHPSEGLTGFMKCSCKYVGMSNPKLCYVLSVIYLRRAMYFIKKLPRAPKALKRRLFAKKGLKK